MARLIENPDHQRLVIATFCRLLNDRVVEIRRGIVVKLAEADLSGSAASLATERLQALCQCLLTDPDAAVRGQAAEALGILGNENAIPALCQALEQDTNTAVRLKLVDALGNLSSGKVSPSVRVPPTHPVARILHLSDLHFGMPEQATLWANQLAADLCYEIQIPWLDGLILSGDIANRATPEDYAAAQQFLDHLLQEFPLEPEQIVIVPGNHDLNWELARQAYSLKDRAGCEADELKPGRCIEVTADVVRVRDEEKYQQRFIHFSRFYQTIKGTAYALEYDQQYMLECWPDRKLLILGLNSAWELDWHYNARAGIHQGALSNALREIRRHEQYAHYLKLAVWHHPLESAGTDRVTDRGFLEQLAVAGFRFFLHGHIHKAETSLYRYDISQSGRKLDRICAGTFGAPTRELVPAYPWQYNLLTVEGEQLTVHTRRREAENGAWKPDARWSQGSGKGALDFYQIEI